MQPVVSMSVPSPPRYTLAPAEAKCAILDEFCATTGYHRKYAIMLLNHPTPGQARPRRRRRPRYPEQAIRMLTAIWEAAGYPWSARLKALLPLWLPWARRHFSIPLPVERALRTMSPSTMDRRLQPKKRQVRRRLYGRTKPGTLLKHHIPIRTDHWDLTTPGFTEVDLVSRSGNRADGEVLQSLNLTDILTGWVESSALWGKSQRTVRAALEELRAACPSRCAGSTRTTARNSSTRSCCSTAAGGRSPSPAGAPTRRTTTRTPSRRIGRMCGSSWAGIAVTRVRRRPRSTISTATNCAS